MEFNFGHSAPSGSASRSSSNWLGFGQRVAMPNSSPGAPPNVMADDEVSFAESYGPETSPLFNPLYAPRDTTAETAPSLATSPRPAPTWPRQRDASTLDHTLNSNNFSSPDVFPLPVKPATQEHAPMLSSEQPAIDEPIVQQETTEEIVRIESDINTLVAGESRVEVYEHTETIVQSSEKQPEESSSQSDRENEAATGEADRVEETPPDAHADLLSDAEKLVDGQKTPLREQSDSPEPDSAPAAGPSKLRSALLSLGSGIMKRMSAPPSGAVATSEQDDIQARRAMSSQPEQQVETGASTPSLVVELKKMSETEKASFTEVSDSNQEDIPANVVSAPSAKRGRPRKQSLAGKSTSSATKPAHGRRSIASAPASPAVKKTPASVAVQRARKSMPASTTVDETPKKRGRPRKSDVVATPAPPPGTAKRGRPRKSEATPIAVPSASKPLSARGRRVASASKAAVTPRRPTAVRTPKTAIGLQAAATPTSIPRPRGRPPKNPKPVEEAEPEVETSKRAGRASQASNSTENVPPKATRAVKPRAVSSPAKRGRPAKKADAPVPKTETQTATKRGRRAAVEPKEDVPAKEPKRRGRPAAKVGAPSVEELTSEPKTRKRGRTTATEETLADEPAPKRRGRVVKSAAEEEPAPAPRRRGHTAASETTGKSVAEPATTKKRGAAKTATKTKDTTSEPAAPKKRGRAAAAKAVEDVTETTTKRGRGKRSAPELEPEAEAPEPATKKRRTTSKAEETAPTKSTKVTSGRKPGRPAKAKKEAAEETVPKRGKSARSKIAELAPIEDAPKPAKRGRGPAKKSTEPAVEAESKLEKPKARGRPAKEKSGKGELPSSKNADAPAAKRGRGAATNTIAAKAKTTAAAPTKVTKTGRAAQTGVRRGLRSRG